MSAIITLTKEECSVVAAQVRRPWSLVERMVRQWIAPIGAMAATVLLGAPAGTVVLVALVIALCQRSTDRYASRAAFLPLMRTIHPVVGAALALVALVTLKATTIVVGVTVEDLLIISLVAALGGILRRVNAPFSGGGRPLRVAVVGSAATALDLALELQLAGNRSLVVGYAPPEQAAGQRDLGLPQIGALGGLASMIVAHRIDLLVFSAEIPRLTFFEELASGSLHAQVHAVALSQFYEEAFGHVPLLAINAAWFQCVMHPHYSTATPLMKRIVDILIASVAGVVLAPVMAILALLIKRDGGHIIYRQTRIGEGGKPFEILKLRSMTETTSDAQLWSSQDDDRITGIGRFMRRTHLDEVPQVLNVLRGDMTIVGPRPEQPDFVERLERTVAFYSRRHLIRPGITGWAQVRCGYAGSDVGTASKVCHDLYYLKHRSMTLDLLILGETVRTLFADRQWKSDMTGTQAFVLAVQSLPTPSEPEPAVQVTAPSASFVPGYSQATPETANSA